MKFWTFEKNLWSEFISVEIMNYEVARKKEKAKQTSVREKIAHDYAYACLLKEKDRSNVILYNTNTTFDRLARMKPRDLNRSIAVVLFSIIRLLTKKSIKVFFFLHWTFPRGIHTGQNQFSTIIFWNTSLTINTMLTCLNPQVDAWFFSFDSLQPKVRNGKKIKNHWCVRETSQRHTSWTFRLPYKVSRRCAAAIFLLERYRVCGGADLDVPEKPRS